MKQPESMEDIDFHEKGAVIILPAAGELSRLHMEGSKKIWQETRRNGTISSQTLT